MATVRQSVEQVVDKSPDEPSDVLQECLQTIAKYDREFKRWEGRAEKVIKRYRDDTRNSTTNPTAKFNILWSNVQTLVPATFARLPQPDVSRRFRDNDPVGRVASLILERALSFEVEHYRDYRDTMRQSVFDRFLGGRGTAWARYEPHFKQAEVLQITEDADTPEIEEQLDYECAPIDYVHWKDFGHSVARTWEEVTCVWRKVYMSQDAVKERFGEEIAKKIPYDATPEDLKKGKNQDTEIKQQALVYEYWDKEKGMAYWFSKSMKEMLDEREDPLKLQEFFPCPKPLFATITNETLVPIPDFTLYQDQAQELDVLSDRIDGLSTMLQLKGVYDASADASLARLFTEGQNGTLLPVKNWAAFAEKNGLKGQIDVYDLTPLTKALEAAYQAMEQIKNQIYEIMGISDIIRGSSDPNETLGAQELKGQYASMRLRAMQGEVARYATDILQLKAQIMCGKFNPKTLAAIAAVDQLSDMDKSVVYLMDQGSVDPATGQPAPPKPIPGPDGKPQPLGPAMVLLLGQERINDPEGDTPNPLRSFRVEVNADSMIQMDEAAEKRDRMEFLTATGTFIEKAAPVMQMAPQAGPLLMEMLKFGITAFKVGKTVEGKFDEMIDKMMQAAMNPKPPPPDPAVEAEKAKAEAAKEKAQLDVQVAQTKAGIEVKKMQTEQQMEQQQLAIDQQAMQQDMAFQQAQGQMDAQQQQQAMKMKEQQMAAQHAQKMKMASQSPARKQ